MSLEIFKGNSTGLIKVKAGNFDFGGAGWQATLKILELDGRATDVPNKTMVKDPGDKFFAAQLSPTDTALLKVKTYLIAIVVENTVTLFKRDAYEQLTVRKSFITP